MENETLILEQNDTSGDLVADDNIAATESLEVLKPSMITINMDKAKTISHDIRRQKRAEEFKPLDEVIMKQIPGADVQAIEAERQLIRDKYHEIQNNIDLTENIDDLLTIVKTL